MVSGSGSYGEGVLSRLADSERAMMSTATAKPLSGAAALPSAATAPVLSPGSPRPMLKPSTAQASKDAKQVNKDMETAMAEVHKQVRKAFTTIQQEKPGFIAKLEAFFSCLGTGFTQAFSAICQEIDQKAAKITDEQEKANTLINDLAAGLQINRESLIKEVMSPYIDESLASAGLV